MGGLYLFYVSEINIIHSFILLSTVHHNSLLHSLLSYPRNTNFCFFKSLSKVVPFARFCNTNAIHFQHLFALVQKASTFGSVAFE